MDLYWDSGTPCLYVRGHVSAEDFFAALSDAGVDAERYEAPRQAYARYAVTGWSRASDCDFEILDYGEPGRGRFKVTRADEVNR